MTIILGILLFIFVVTGSYSLYVHFAVTSLVTLLAGFSGLAFAFLKALSNSNLHVYFWFQRARIWWLSDSVTRWWFAAGFDGDFPPLVIHDLMGFLQDKERFRFGVRIDYHNDREVQAEIDKTLTLRIGFDPASLSASGQGHISIISKPMEVSCGHARKKIETQIIPIILALKDSLQPTDFLLE